MSARNDMYLDADLYPAARALERSWAPIRAEMLAMPHDRYEPIADGLVASGRWGGLGLLDALDPARAQRWRANAEACPSTSRILARIQGLQVGGFLLMEPGTRLIPHADLQEPRFLNFMLALAADRSSWMRVGTETRTHAAGTCVVFDPRTEHEAANEGSRARVTLYAAVSVHAARLPLLASEGEG